MITEIKNGRHLEGFCFHRPYSPSLLTVHGSEGNVFQPRGLIRYKRGGPELVGFGRQGSQVEHSIEPHPSIGENDLPLASGLLRLDLG